MELHNQLNNKDAFAIFQNQMLQLTLHTNGILKVVTNNFKLIKFTTIN